MCSASTLPQFACFLFFWAINMFVIYRGIDSIRMLLNIKAPLLIALGLALLAWAYRQPAASAPCSRSPRHSTRANQRRAVLGFLLPRLTGMVGFWATLSLNIPDFSRYAKSQRDQVLGQALGLPTTMALYSFIGVAVTSATMIIYRRQPLQERFGILSTCCHSFQNPVVLIIAMFCLCLATLATNIAANVVSPANDFAHLVAAKNLLPHRRPDHRHHRHPDDALETHRDPKDYIFTWLIAYSVLARICWQACSSPTIS